MPVHTEVSHDSDNFNNVFLYCFKIFLIYINCYYLSTLRRCIPWQWRFWRSFYFSSGCTSCPCPRRRKNRRSPQNLKSLKKKKKDFQRISLEKTNLGSRFKRCLNSVWPRKSDVFYQHGKMKIIIIIKRHQV